MTYGGLFKEIKLNVRGVRVVRGKNKKFFLQSTNLRAFFSWTEDDCLFTVFSSTLHFLANLAILYHT